MPYSSNSDLPPAVRSRYSDKCQDAFRATWNGEYADHGDEGRAFATAHAAAKRCQGGTKSMELTNAETRNPEGPHFKIASGAMRPIADTGDGKKRVRTIVSSSIEDRSGDVVSLPALQRMAASAKGLTVFRNHSHKVPDDVFGYIESAHVQQTNAFDSNGSPVWDLMSDIIVNKDEKSQATYDMVTDGLQLGVSIGAQIPAGGAKKNAAGGYTFDNLSLLEASIVGIPDNPRAFVLNAVKAIKAFDIEVEDEEDTNDGFVTETEKNVAPEEAVEIAADGTQAVIEDRQVEKVAAADGSVKEGIEVKEGEEAELVQPAEAEKDADLDVLKDLDIDFDNLPEGDDAEAEAWYAEMDAQGAAKEEVSFSANLDLLKAPLSAAARNNLGDSQFACPSKRKYPIHDKAHIPAALSRCGASSNDQCGCDTVRAAARKAGIGDSEKAAEPLELVKEAAVVAADPVDETPAQEPSGDPESAEEDALLSDTLTRSTAVLADLVKSTSRENVTLRKQLETTQSENATLKQKLHDAETNLVLAKQIVGQIAKTPFGRKAVVAEKVSEFDSLETKFGGIYSPEVLKSL